MLEDVEVSELPPRLTCGMEVRRAFCAARHRPPALLCISAGSVTDFQGDAIVNAANTGGLTGGGVDGAVSRKGGPSLQVARRALPVVPGTNGVRIPCGEARLTVGGDLGVGHVIHACGPNYTMLRRLKFSAPVQNEDEEEAVQWYDSLLYNAYVSALRVASTLQQHCEGASGSPPSGQRAELDPVEEKPSTAAATGAALPLLNEPTESALMSVPHVESVAVSGLTLGFSLLSSGIFRGDQTLRKMLEIGMYAVQSEIGPGMCVHLVAFNAEEMATLLAIAEACVSRGTDSSWAHLQYVHTALPPKWMGNYSDKKD